MASATRVEKLQYKEIPTPSWRVNDVISEGDELKMEVTSTDYNKISFRKKEFILLGGGLGEVDDNSLLRGWILRYA